MTTHEGHRPNASTAGPTTSCPECRGDIRSVNGEPWWETCRLFVDESRLDHGFDPTTFDDGPTRDRTDDPLTVTRHDLGRSTEIGWERAGRHGRDVDRRGSATTGRNTGQRPSATSRRVRTGDAVVGRAGAAEPRPRPASVRMREVQMRRDCPVPTTRARKPSRPGPPSALDTKRRRRRLWKSRYVFIQ